MTEQRLPLGLSVYANRRGKYGAEFDPNYCAASVAFGGRRVDFHQCSHKWKVEKRGYRWCGIHDPDKVEERLKKSAARYEAQSNIRMAPYRRIEKLETTNAELLEALKAMLREHGSVGEEGLYSDRCECGGCMQARRVICGIEEPKGYIDPMTWEQHGV